MARLRGRGTFAAMFWHVLFACTSQDSRPGPSSPTSTAPSTVAPTPTTGALELHVKGPPIAAKPVVERPNGCIDDAAVAAAPAGPVAEALVWVDGGTARPRAAKLTWSGCRPSDTAFALTPRSAIAVRNEDPIPLEIGVTAWPGSSPPASWRTLPPGSSAGVSFPSEPGLYLLVDKNHAWAKVLVAIGSASAKSAADGLVRLQDLPIGTVDVHVAHADLDRVVDVKQRIAVGLTKADVDLGEVSASGTAP
jgi:hypothetical protein